MKERKISEANFCDTGYSYTLSLIAGKYKPIVLYCLMEYEPVRFNEMQRYLGNAQSDAERTGTRRTDTPGDVSGDPAKGGILANGTRSLACSSTGSAMRLG